MHVNVIHPNELLSKPVNLLEKINDSLLTWITDHILGSVLIFDIALVAPLACWNASDSTKLTLGLISGSWIQWWALHGLQRRSMKADALHDAKVNADHAAMTHIATQVDAILQKLENTNIAVGKSA